MLAVRSFSLRAGGTTSKRRVTGPTRAPRSMVSIASVMMARAMRSFGFHWLTRAVPWIPMSLPPPMLRTGR